MTSIIINAVVLMRGVSFNVYYTCFLLNILTQSGYCLCINWNFYFYNNDDKVSYCSQVFYFICIVIKTFSKTIWIRYKFDWWFNEFFSYSFQWCFDEKKKDVLSFQEPLSVSIVWSLFPDDMDRYHQYF